MARMEAQGTRAQIRDKAREPSFILVVTIPLKGSGNREGIDRATMRQAGRSPAQSCRKWMPANRKEVDARFCRR